MLVVLDTNVIVESGYRLSSQTWMILWNARERLGFEIVVPEVVVLECVQKYKEKLMEIKINFLKWGSECRKIMGNDPALPAELSDTESSAMAYETDLRNLLKERRVLIAPFPDVDHLTLATRAVRKERPFARGKDGYRDALIWQTVANLANEGGDRVVFVTNNSSDFAERRGSQLVVHPELQRDIDDEERLEMVTNANDLNVKHVIPTMESLSIIAKVLWEGEHESLDLVGFLEDNLQGMLKPLEEFITLEVAGIEDDADYFRFESVVGVDELDEVDVRKLDETTLLIDIDAVVACEFEMGASVASDAAFHFDLLFDNDASTYNGWVNKSLDILVRLVVDAISYNVVSAKIKRIGREGMIYVGSSRSPETRVEFSRSYRTHSVEFE